MDDEAIIRIVLICFVGVALIVCAFVFGIGWATDQGSARTTQITEQARVSACDRINSVQDRINCIDEMVTTNAVIDNALNTCSYNYNPGNGLLNCITSVLKDVKQ